MSTAVGSLPEIDLGSGLVAGAAKKRRRGLGLWIGVTIVALVVLATVIVRVAHLGHPDTVNLLSPQESPSLSHPFGTDALGRDVFMRMVYASGLDLEVGLVTTLAPLVIGMLYGLIAGFFGGWVDAVIMRVIDALLAFPFIVLIVAFVTIFGVGLTGAYSARR